MADSDVALYASKLPPEFRAPVVFLKILEDNPGVILALNRLLGQGLTRCQA